MQCPECKAWTEVLETRKNALGKRRRYVCANQHRFTTLEQVTISKPKEPHDIQGH